MKITNLFRVIATYSGLYLIFAITFSACTAKEAQIIDDIIEGEAQTVEKVVNDTIGPPNPPSANVIKKKI